MRFTTTAGRAAAVALAAATLGLGATTAAQAVTIGGSTAITNGSCTVLAEYFNGDLAFRLALGGVGCSFGIVDSTTGSWIQVPAPLAPEGWYSRYVGPDRKLSGCVYSGMSTIPVCAPIAPSA
ncbi:hypothetical protein [Kitasatospora sp. NBC_01302]|uniref:hypothetical protein n=1 Tax=Kitasatospora sp. NBC_01302 TaxID=2903575 RepID=UPI002E0DE7D1|nr:hypothetical protein OG294_30650 [Kitasatospora sp. NBC_01302]